MKIGLLTRDLHGIPPVPGGCAFYRCYLPMHALAAYGHRVNLGKPVYDPIHGYGVKEREGMGVFGFDTIMLKLIMDKTAATQMRLARNNAGQRFLVDIDDYYQGLTPANKAYELSNPKTNPWANREHYNNVIMEADTLTVSTPFLRDYYSEFHPDVRLVRNGVNAEMFTPVTHNEKPVLGWVGATNYRNNDLEQLSEWLPDFLEEHDLMVHHAGASPDAPTFQDVTGVNPDRVTVTPLVPITRYADGFTFHIGLVPLSDIPFNHAKSTIKGLEYAAAGIPFVASDLPEYRLLHEQGIGTLARTPEEWRTAVEALLPRGQRVREGQRIRSLVRKHHTIDATARDWVAAFTA